MKLYHVHSLLGRRCNVHSLLGRQWLTVHSLLGRQCCPFLAWKVPEEELHGDPKNLIMEAPDFLWNVKLDNELNHSIYDSW